MKLCFGILSNSYFRFFYENNVYSYWLKKININSLLSFPECICAFLQRLFFRRP